MNSFPNILSVHQLGGRFFSPIHLASLEVRVGQFSIFGEETRCEARVLPFLFIFPGDLPYAFCQSVCSPNRQAGIMGRIAEAIRIHS